MPLCAKPQQRSPFPNGFAKISSKSRSPGTNSSSTRYSPFSFLLLGYLAPPSLATEGDGSRFSLGRFRLTAGVRFSSCCLLGDKGGPGPPHRRQAQRRLGSRLSCALYRTLSGQVCPPPAILLMREGSTGSSGWPPDEGPCLSPAQPPASVLM